MIFSKRLEYWLLFLGVLVYEKEFQSRFRPTLKLTHAYVSWMFVAHQLIIFCHSEHCKKYWRLQLKSNHLIDFEWLFTVPFLVASSQPAQLVVNHRKKNISKLDQPTANRRNRNSNHRQSQTARAVLGRRSVALISRTIDSDLEKNARRTRCSDMCSATTTTTNDGATLNKLSTWFDWEIPEKAISYGRDDGR